MYILDRIRKPKVFERKYELWSNSRLVDVNTCPIYGVVHKKRVYGTARAMALEAGSAMHEIFAAIRLWQIGWEQGYHDHMNYHGDTMFGERWHEANAHALEHVRDPKSDPHQHLTLLCFKLLHSGPFYDDPSDNVRTLANMEVSTMNYIDRQLPNMEDWPIYVHDKNDPTAYVGVETTFDTILDYKNAPSVRFAGTADGLAWSNYYKRHFLLECKTASRLDEAWRKSFLMSHQVTGYMAVLSHTLGIEVRDAHAQGVKIKQSGYGDDLVFELVKRDEHAIAHWANWVRETVDMYERFENDWENAPRYTHSCNRYFRPCSFISFCADTPEGRIEQYDEMVTPPMSPTEQAVEELYDDKF